VRLLEVDMRVSILLGILLLLFSCTTTFVYFVPVDKDNKLYSDDNLSIQIRFNFKRWTDDYADLFRISIVRGVNINEISINKIKVSFIPINNKSIIVPWEKIVYYTELGKVYDVPDFPIIIKKIYALSIDYMTSIKPMEFTEGMEYSLQVYLEIEVEGRKKEINVRV